MTADEPVPLEWRTLLAEIFIEAERHGLGTYQPGFTAPPGREDAAAAFIGERADHLAEIRPGGCDVTGHTTPSTTARRTA